MPDKKKLRKFWNKKARARVLSGVVVALLTLTAVTGFFVALPKQTSAATSDDWNITNWNYTVGFQPTVVRADSNYVFVANEGGYLHQIYRSNGTLKQNMTIPANITLLMDMQSDGNYLYIGGRTSSSAPFGWRVIKYSLPDLTWSAEYYNSAWYYPARILINDTYVWLSGAQDSSKDGSIIKLYKSTMTETGDSVEVVLGADDYFFEMKLDSTETYLYAANKVYGNMGKISKFYAGNLTYIDSYQTTGASKNFLTELIICSDDCIIAGSVENNTGYEQGVYSVDSALSEQWNNTWDIPPTMYDLEEFNSTHFLSSEDGGIDIRYASNGSVDWSYTGFDDGNLEMAHYGNYAYACGIYSSIWVLRNITIGTGESSPSYPNPPSGQSATAYTNFDISLSGLDANTRITFPTATVDDTTGDIVWANETSYGVLTVSNDGIQQINLSWVKGSGATNTVIRYATSDPGTWTLSTGTALYNDTGTSFNHQNLDAGTHYYYALWSWNTSGYSETYVTCDAVAGNASVTNLTIHIEDVGSGTALVPKENFTLYGNASGSYASLGAFDATTGNVTLTTSYAGLPLAIGDKLYFEFKATVGAGAQPSGTYYDNNAQTLDCYVKAER